MQDGVIPSLVTPMHSSGAVDEDGLRTLVDFAVRAGASGILCTALAGEVSQLAASERRTVIEVVIDAVGGRLPVIAGVGNEEGEAPLLARFALERGADAVMLSPPPGTSAAHACGWLTRTALGLEGRVILQEAPGYLGNAAGPAGLRTVVRECENVRDIKIEGGSHALSIARSVVGETVTFWGGDGGLHALDCLRAGAAGFMPGVEIVDVLVDVYRSARRDDHDDAQASLGRALPLLVFEMQSLATYVASAKRVLTSRGLLASATSRLAPAEVSKELEQTLHAHLRAAMGDRAER